MSSPTVPAEGQILTGSLFNEPMRVETVSATGEASWTLGLVGTQSERFRRVSLAAAELAELTVHESGFRYDADGAVLRLGLQAHALGIAWEFDPYFGLSVSRVDPLPHQLEAVYDHLLKLARVRFLLADDAGAGKTIMAGLLIRELQLRGLAERVLIVVPSNLTFQWQRELREKFDAPFQVMKGGDLREQFGVTASGDLRLIEVKGLAAATGTILLTPNERRVAEDRRDCYWLYVVTDCGRTPVLRDPVADPARFPWHEVRKVQHYYLDVDAMVPAAGDRERRNIRHPR